MMQTLFYLTAVLVLISAVLVICQKNTMHALLYLVLMMLAIAVLFYLLGAPFAAALEIIVYAGAIMVLVVFVIMMLNQGEAAAQKEGEWLESSAWWGPALLSGLLLVELLPVMFGVIDPGHKGDIVEAKQVGIALFGSYLLAVELASILLMAGLVGAFHLAKNLSPQREDG